MNANGNPYKRVAFVALTVIAASYSLDAPAQLNTAAAAAAQSKVTAFLSFFASLVQVAGYSLFVIAIMMAGYKITFVDGYKPADAKGIVIGGIVFGLAAVLATFLTT